MTKTKTESKLEKALELESRITAVFNRIPVAWRSKMIDGLNEWVDRGYVKEVADSPAPPAVPLVISALVKENMQLQLKVKSVCMALDIDEESPASIITSKIHTLNEIIARAARLRYFETTSIESRPK